LCPGYKQCAFFNKLLAGDIRSWVHPQGFTITNTIKFNAAQEITQISSSLSSSVQPSTLVQSITYTPFGAISTLLNGCTGSNCLNIQEKYDYNNRLQPARIELGTSSFPSGNYCLVYNYYSGSNTTNCAVPVQGSGNNGNVMGYWYQDSINVSLGHQVTNTYDYLNRLTNSKATAVSPGTVSYNFPVTIDRWGNATCNIHGNPSGPTCANVTFNTSTNHITAIGSASVSYDAAGNLTSDGVNTYQWDAENHLAKIVAGSVTENLTYNAYGWRVYNSSGSVSYLLDPAGQFLGGRWTNGGNSAVFLGSRMLAEYMSNGVDFDHVSVLGSDTQMTDFAGSGGQGILYYPWGQVWSNPSGLFGNTFYQRYASLQLYDTATDGYVPPFRYYVSNQGRWLTPDPLAGDILNPQSLNRYAYVLNNPTSMIDPLGLVTGPPPPPPLPPAPVGPPPPESPPPDCYWSELHRQIVCPTPDHPIGPPSQPPPSGPGGGTPQSQPQAPTKQTIKKFAVWYVCGTSPSENVWHYVEFGALKGLAVGAVIGGVTGAVLGEGVGAVPGAILGGLIEGTVGGTGGLFLGAAASGVCSVAGVYGG
jgi:RHS repeat-associated protein